MQYKLYAGWARVVAIAATNNNNAAHDSSNNNSNKNTPIFTQYKIRKQQTLQSKEVWQTTPTTHNYTTTHPHHTVKGKMNTNQENNDPQQEGQQPSPPQQQGRDVLTPEEENVRDMARQLLASMRESEERIADAREQMDDAESKIRYYKEMIAKEEARMEEHNREMERRRRQLYDILKTSLEAEPLATTDTSAGAAVLSSSGNNDHLTVLQKRDILIGAALALANGRKVEQFVRLHQCVCNESFDELKKVLGADCHATSQELANDIEHLDEQKIIENVNILKLSRAHLHEDIWTRLALEIELSNRGYLPFDKKSTLRSCFQGKNGASMMDVVDLAQFAELEVCLCLAGTERLSKREIFANVMLHDPRHFL